MKAPLRLHRHLSFACECPYGPEAPPSAPKVPLSRHANPPHKKRIRLCHLDWNTRFDVAGMSEYNVSETRIIKGIAMLLGCLLE